MAIGWGGGHVSGNVGNPCGNPKEWRMSRCGTLSNVAQGPTKESTCFCEAGSVTVLEARRPFWG